MLIILLISSAIVGLLFLNSSLVACQTSLVKLRYTQPNKEALRRLKRRRATRHILNDTHHTARILRFSIGICMITVGVLTFVGLDLLMLFVGDKVIIGLLALMLAICVYYSFLEAIPRRLAVKYPEKTLRHTGWIVVVFEVLIFPLYRLMRWIVNGVSGWLNLKAEENFNLLDTEVQLRALGQQNEALSPVIRQIMNNAFQMSGLTVQDILLPRHQIQYFDLENGVEANLKLARETGHTRFPLCKGDLDQCVGIIHIKDIFRYRGNIEHLDLLKIRRRVINFYSDDPLEKALQKLLRLKMHMARVADEFGGTLGVITLEHLLEKLVGSIQDEFDHEEANITALSDNIYRILGLTPIHEIEEVLGITFENVEVSTFGGLITAELGRIPQKEERLSLPYMEVLVEDVDEKRVIAAKVWAASAATNKETLSEASEEID